MLDACTGNRGSSDPMALFSLSQNAAISAPVVAPCHEKKCAANQDESSSSQAHHIHSNGAIFARTRIVVIAEEQDLIDRSADLILGSLHQTQADVARRIFHAIEVSRELALRSKNHDGAGMRELAGGRIELILVAHRLGKCFDGP